MDVDACVVGPEVLDFGVVGFVCIDPDVLVDEEVVVSEST